MNKFLKISALAFAVLGCASAFAVSPDATAAASHELDLSVAFASDPSRVSYGFGLGTNGSYFPYASGNASASWSTSYSWPTFSDNSLGVLSGSTYAITGAPSGHAGAISEFDNFTISFTNNSTRKRSVSFEADFSDVLSALVGDPAHQAAGAAAQYYVFDGVGNTVLHEYDQLIGGPGASSSSHSYVDQYSFFLGAGQTQTFHIFVGDASEAITQAVPEPMTLGVLGVGLVALIRRRKKA